MCEGVSQCLLRVHEMKVQSNRVRADQRQRHRFNRLLRPRAQPCRHNDHVAVPAGGAQVFFMSSKKHLQNLQTVLSSEMAVSYLNAMIASWNNAKQEKLVNVKRNR